MTDVAELGIQVTGSEAADRNAASLDALAMSSDRAEKAAQKLKSAYLSQRTAMQENIDRLTGVGAATKSAEKSAQSMSAFILNQNGAYKSLGATMANVTTGIQKTINANVGLNNATKSASSSAQTFITSMFAQSAAAEGLSREVNQTDTALQRHINSLVGVERAHMSAAASARVLEGAERAYGDQLQRVLMTVDPVYAASKRYESAIEQITVARNRGTLSEAMAQRAMTQAASYYLDASNTQIAATNRLEAAQTKIGSTMRGTRGVMQNLSWQVQDVAVQMQMGTDSAIIFAQQGSQIASAFGPVGAMIGAAMAVIPLVALGLKDYSKAAKVSTDYTGDFADSLSKLVDFASETTFTTRKMAEEFGVFAQEIKDFSAFMAMISLDDSFTDLDAYVESVKGNFTEILNLAAQAEQLQKQLDAARAAANAPGALDVNPTALLDAQEAVDMIADKSESIARALGLTVVQAEDLAAALKDVADATTTQDVVRAATAALAIFENIRTTSGRINPALLPIVSSLDKIQREAARTATELSRLPGILSAATNAAMATAGAVTSIGNAAASSASKVLGLAQSIFQAAAAAAAARVSANNSLDAMRMEFSPGGQALGKYGGRGAPSKDQEDLADTYDMYGNVIDKDKKKGGGGGGGGGEDEWQKEYEQLMEQLTSKEQLQMDAYERQQEMIEEAYERKLLTQEEYNEAMENAENQHAWEMYQIKRQESELVRSAAQGMYGELEGLLGMFAQKSKGAAIAAIALNKGLRIAEIIQNTAAAQMRAFAELGPVAGAVAAAKIGLYGKIQAGIVAATGLMQAGSVGGSGGPSGGGGGARGVDQGLSGDTQSPLTVRFIGRTGRRFTEEEVEELVNAVFDIQKRGRNVVPGVVFQ